MRTNLSTHSGLFQQILLNASSLNGATFVEVDVNVLSKAAGVVVSRGLGVAEGWEADQTLTFQQSNCIIKRFFDFDLVVELVPSRIGFASRICCLIQERCPLTAARNCSISLVLSVFPAPDSPLVSKSTWLASKFV